MQSRDDKFVMTPWPVIWSAGTGASLLWAVLMDYQGENPNAWPSQHALATDLGRQPHTIGRWARELEGCGLLEVSRNRGSCNTYRALLPTQKHVENRPAPSSKIDALPQKARRKSTMTTSKIDVQARRKSTTNQTQEPNPRTRERTPPPIPVGDTPWEVHQTAADPHDPNEGIEGDIRMALATLTGKSAPSIQHHQIDKFRRLADDYGLDVVQKAIADENGVKHSWGEWSTRFREKRFAEAKKDAKQNGQNKSRIHAKKGKYDNIGTHCEGWGEPKTG